MTGSARSRSEERPVAFSANTSFNIFYGNNDRTVIRLGWLMYRLLFFDSTVVIDKYEGIFILWIHITLSAFVPGAQIA